MRIHAAGQSPAAHSRSIGDRSFAGPGQQPGARDASTRTIASLEARRYPSPDSRRLAVMPLLIDDVPDQAAYAAIVHRESRIAVLPPEFSSRGNILAHPMRAPGLDVPDDCAQRDRRRPGYQQVDMIPDTAGADDSTVMSLRNGRHFPEQREPPFGVDPLAPILRPPEQVRPNLHVGVPHVAQSDRGRE